MRASSFNVDDRRFVLRHCAELLDLDPDHVARSGALMCGTVEVQGRESMRIFFGCDCELKPSVLPSCRKFAKRASTFKLEPC